MMRTEIITLCVRLAVAVAVIWIVPMAKRFLEEKLEIEKYNRIVEIAKTAVKAAEQLYHPRDTGDYEGGKRQNYAKRMIVEACGKVGIVLSPDEISAIVESAVQEVNILKAKKEGK